ncbi:hypothetical protein [Shimia marina]|uniref:DUF2497 domain-containing protein n=1 Tax=Shimia marina TaxID=321267 RepID=A0A0P1FF96_9RHOB|nr:hypothetical protein [Shimia marina]CUH54045.1 hypothetical protein SHM7688_03514 [Shimia marina]SFE71002.1 hypothetical protein SAMN04488037_11657 [Shimia marina]
MSDPVTNTEIEDVLTSIRRLVSENRPLNDADEKIEAHPEAGAAGSISEPDQSEPLALVLTPALRIDEEPLEDSGVAELKQSEPDTTEDSFIADAPQEVLAGEEVEGSFSFKLGEVETEQDAQMALEAEISADVSDINGEEERVDEDQPFDFKQVLEARIHQFREESSAEDVETSLEDEGGFSEAVVADVSESLANEVVQPSDVADSTDFALPIEEAAEIDEAMLREMVADIVRQELQGALGERITRNVRKLVRREIHRALAAHDLG